MSMLITPPDAHIVQQMERQLTVYLRDGLARQPMAEADRWLYSVWEGQPDWMLLQRLVTSNDRLVTVTEVPVLMGCLQSYRRTESKSNLPEVLVKQQTLTYQRIVDTLDQQGTGLLTDGGASLHYFVLTNNYGENVQWWRQQLLMQWLTQSRIVEETALDLSLGTGHTGWVLMLIEVLKRMDYAERIEKAVSDIKQQVIHYIDYLLAYQLPIDAQLGNYSFFPTSVKAAEWATSDTESWATGDIGQLLLLYKAGQLLQRPDLVKWADRLSGYLLQRRLLNRIKNDQIGLTDGIAGLSLLYRRLFLLTNRTDFLTEGYYWFGQLLQRVQAGDYGPDPSLLTGTLGIAGAIRQWQGADTGFDLLFL